MLDTRYEQRDTRMATEEIVPRYFLTYCKYVTIMIDIKEVEEFGYN